MSNNRAFERKVTLNVQGRIYETFTETLNRFPETAIGTHEKRCCLYDAENEWIFLNCSPKVFDGILFYYQTKGAVLSRPLDADVSDFIDVCEKLNFNDEAIGRIREREGYTYIKEPPPRKLDSTLRSKTWLFFSNPDSSNFAAFYACISVFLIFVSVFVNCLVTIPPIRQERSHDVDSDIWVRVDLSINTFFAIEYLCRLYASPRRWSFVMDKMNMVDVAAIFPQLMIQILSKQELQHFTLIKPVRVLRTMRLLRLHKGFHNIGIALIAVKDCGKDLFFLLLCLFVVCFTCGSAEYFIENSIPGNTFVSVPESMWWALQTVVTLGYGDVVPISTAGKAMGGVVAYCGIMILSVPLLFLGGKFMRLYTDATYAYVTVRQNLFEKRRYIKIY